MKKFILSTILFISTIASAGEWKVFHQKADELLGDPDYDVFYYSDGNFQFGYSTKDSSIVVIYKGCVFDCEYNSLYKEFGEYVLVGLYNSAGELVEKGRLFMSSIDKMDALGLREYQVYEDWNKKIINHIRTRGYVRIVADTYSCKTLDVRIPGRGK